MKTVPLGKLTTLVSSGSTPLGGDKVYLPSGPVMLIRSQNVLMRQLSLDDVAFITEEVASRMKRTIVSTNDVLLNITGASIGRVATFDLPEVQANVNQHVCIIRTIPELLHYRYLMHFIAQPSFQTYIDSMQHGGTRQALTFSQIRDFQIPLPPLEEQRRIAAILDKADAVRRKRKEAIALTEELLRSAFLDMFGDPVTNPKGWNLVSFEEAGIKIIDGDRGKSYPSGNQLMDKGFCIFLNTKNVSEWGFDFTKCQFISQERDELMRQGKLQRGDVILTTRGTLGNVAFYGNEVPFDHLRINSGMLIFRVNTKVFDARFLYFLLKSPFFTYQLSKSQSGSAQPQIPMQRLKEFQIPFPELSQQKRMASILASIENKRSKYLLLITDVDCLFNSLLQKAFQGEL